MKKMLPIAAILAAAALLLLRPQEAAAAVRESIYHILEERGEYM